MSGQEWAEEVWRNLEGQGLGGWGQRERSPLVEGEKVAFELLLRRWGLEVGAVPLAPPVGRWQSLA